VAWKKLRRSEAIHRTEEYGRGSGENMCRKLGFLTAVKGFGWVPTTAPRRRHVRSMRPCSAYEAAAPNLTSRVTRPTSPAGGP